MENVRSLTIIFMLLKLDLARVMQCLISLLHFASVVSQDPK